MRNLYPSLLNTLLTFAEKFARPSVNQKAGDGPDAQADASDQADKGFTSSEDDIDFGAPRWIYRSHYRSIFPHMY
ncbi:MAG: hypothetical protein IPJ46_21040 [Anaerolineales bacterium]|nr:hypothetical protein [Anaerolineales bacterium]